MVKILPATQESQGTWVGSLGQEDPLEEKMEAPSSVLGRIMLWIGVAGYDPGVCKESDKTESVCMHAYCRTFEKYRIV